MNTRPVVFAIAAFSMSVSSAAFAQSDKDVMADRVGQVERGERPAVDRSQPRPMTHEQRTWARVHGGDRRDLSGHQPGDSDDNRGRYRSPPPAYGYRDGRGAGPNHSFYRGGHLPQE